MKVVATGRLPGPAWDELPDAENARNRTVNIVLRYSVPVFFYPTEGAPPKLAWSVDQTGGKLAIVATNTGDRHLRIAGLKLRDANGELVSFGNGLTGYVSGGTSPLGQRRRCCQHRLRIAHVFRCGAGVRALVLQPNVHGQLPQPATEGCG